MTLEKLRDKENPKSNICKFPWEGEIGKFSCETMVNGGEDRMEGRRGK